MRLAGQLVFRHAAPCGYVFNGAGIQRGQPQRLARLEFAHANFEFQDEFSATHLSRIPPVAAIKALFFQVSLSVAKPCD